MANCVADSEIEIFGAGELGGADDGTVINAVHACVWDIWAIAGEEGFVDIQSLLDGTVSVCVDYHLKTGVHPWGHGMIESVFVGVV